MDESISVRLLIPYAGDGLRSEAVAALQADGQEPELCEIAGDAGYYWLLRRLWTGQADLVIVEQDIVVRAGCVAELLDCERLWCAFEYPYADFGLHAGLGLVKFSAELQRKAPGLMRGVGVRHDAQHPPKHWCRLDTHITRDLTFREHVRKHVHRPPVEHLGGHSHGCQ